MKIRWTPEAVHDRHAIWNHIHADNPMAAIHMDELFGQAVARLIEHPKLGKPGAVPGTRELIPHASYRIVYEILADTVWILTLVHTARKWPPL